MGCVVLTSEYQNFQLDCAFDENWHQQIPCCMTYVGCIYKMYKIENNILCY